jgi:hypothetical protein
MFHVTEENSVRHMSVQVLELPILILLIILKNRAITVADLEAYRVVRC